MSENRRSERHTTDELLHAERRSGEDRRSERRRAIDARIQATTDWILTLDEKIKDPKERADIIARSIVAREVLNDRVNFSKEKAHLTASAAQSKAETALEKSRKDPKTGLWNSEQMSLDYEELIKNKNPFGVLILDLDHFKAVNDIYGHPIGDRVLVQVTRNIVANVRQIRPKEQDIDRAYRYGGEEFTVLLPGISSETDLKNVAERIRNSIGSTPFVVSGDTVERKQIPLTVSIGGGVYRQGDGQDFFLQVDQRMYVAKHEGRNRSNILPPQ